MKMNNALLLCFIVLAGCAPAVNPGATLWAGLNNYHEEMRTLQSKPERWPDRQRLGEAIKTTYAATVGGSRAFNRLVDLDLRKRELVIALRTGRLQPERAKEIDKDLLEINDQIDGLAKMVKGQLMNTQLNVQDSSKTIETVATIGLLNLAIEAFSSPIIASQTTTPTTKVGLYLVVDQGTAWAVRTPEGQTFRCTTAVLPDEGASIRCEPAGGQL
jgi:hypothetical protein